MNRFSPFKLGFVFAAMLLMVAGSAFAQLQSGNVFGTVVDNQGQVLPGVTVTISGGGAPQVFVTDDEGSFRFLNLSPGSYTVRADLQGFGTVSRSNVSVNVGRNSEVALTLAPALEQTITVTAETPLLDVRRTGTGATMTKVELNEIPTARDPWVVLQQVPGVLVDRINIGGNESGQQSNYVGKGASGDQATWNVDGVNITDMAAVGSSPTYYDFDSFEEMQATTGGTDPRIMTPGVQLNMVTKRGTNDFRGSGRYFVTDNDWQKEASVPVEARGYLDRANEIDHIDDYGLELGGPLWRDHIWAWAAYSKNQIDLLTAQRPGTTASFDKTSLKNYNAKINAQVTTNNSATFLWTQGDKIKLGRNAGPTRPPETAWNQAGPTNLYKIEDTHIFSPSFYLTGLASQVDGGFGLTPAGGLDVDTYFSDDGVAHRSYYDYRSSRPQDNYRLDGSSFFDTGALNHELKFGFGYRDTPTNSQTTWSGSGNYAYFLEDNFGLAYLTRPGNAIYGTNYKDLYLGDTMLWGNLTLQVGLRYDMQSGANQASSVAANPLIPDLLPSSSYDGDSRELEWNTLSPRIGATWSFGSTRRTLIRGGYNRYVDQLSAGVIAPSNAFYSIQALVYYFEDTNNDQTIQRSEILFDEGLYSFYGLDPENPGVVLDPVGRLDYDMEVPTTDELILGLEHELLPEFTVGLNYTHRNFNDFLWTRFEKTQGSNNFYTSADYVLATSAANPTGTTAVILPNGETVMVPLYKLNPDVAVGTFKVTTNRPDYEQVYDGVELNLTKRLSNRWMMRGNVSYNDWKQNIGPNGFIDPTSTLGTTGCSNCDGEQVVESSGTGSGSKGAVYINSKYSYTLTGLYQFPWQITFGASLAGREGYPIPYYVRLATPRGEGAKNVLVDGIEPDRNEDVMNLDLRLAKEFRIPGGVGLTISADAFNVTDERTVLQRENRLFCASSSPTCGYRADGTAVGATGRLREFQSPQVIRLGARLTF